MGAMPMVVDKAVKEVKHRDVYLMSWALSWGLLGSSLTFRQSRNSCSVVKGSCVTGHLSESLHTSRPTSATRMLRAL
uniref:Uncharacterized protein n=1 Tax=Salarias fasciatus TaxID=181472 RepID=A0A672G3X1_SALFA